MSVAISVTATFAEKPCSIAPDKMHLGGMVWKAQTTLGKSIENAFGTASHPKSLLV